MNQEVRSFFIWLKPFNGISTCHSGPPALTAWMLKTFNHWLRLVYLKCRGFHSLHCHSKIAKTLIYLSICLRSSSRRHDVRRNFTVYLLALSSAPSSFSPSSFSLCTKEQVRCWLDVFSASFVLSDSQPCFWKPSFENYIVCHCFKQKCPHHRPEDAFQFDLLTKTFSLVENLPELRSCVLCLTYHFIYYMHVFVIFTSFKDYLISCSFAVCYETCYGFTFPFRALW